MFIQKCDPPPFLSFAKLMGTEACSQGRFCPCSSQHNGTRAEAKTESKPSSYSSKREMATNSNCSFYHMKVQMKDSQIQFRSHLLTQIVFSHCWRITFFNLNSLQLIYTLGIGFDIIQITCIYFLSLLAATLGEFSSIPLTLLPPLNKVD